MTGDKKVFPKHPLSSKPFQFYQINWAGSVLTGGMTGSVRVVIKNEHYQYKPPIIENSWIRRLKSNDVDSENFGELLASRIAKEFDIDDKHERIPKVSFVVKNRCKDVGIVSRYLKGTKVTTLDDYQDPKRKRRGSHIVLNKDMDAPGAGAVSINTDLHLKKELARAIALSALVGDHDVNPGNMVVISEHQGTTRVGRIDFGHAFNDLLRFPRFGGHRVAQNNIIDFFNRTTIDGPNKPQSRIWRNYPGLIPSREMAEALKELSDQPNQAQRIKDVVGSVKEEVRQMLENNPQVDKDHVIRSFQRISEHVSGKIIPNELKPDEKLEQIFNDIGDYVQLNIKQMAYAADIMMLQVEIREALMNKEPRKLIELKKNYELLAQNQEMGPVAWFRDSDQRPAFTGNFEHYLVHQKRILMTEELFFELHKFKDSPDPSVHTLRTKLLEYLANPRSSAEEKLAQCSKELVDWEHSKQTSSVLQSLMAACRAVLAVLGLVEEELVSDQKNSNEPTEKDKVSKSLKRFSLNPETPDLDDDPELHRSNSPTP